MNKKFYAILFGTSMAFNMNPILSNAEPFIKANIGYAIPTKLAGGNAGFIENKKPGNSMLYGVGVGYKVNEKFSTYVDYTNVNNMKYIANEGDATRKQNIKANLLSLNAQYNINNSSKFIPYIKMGVGVTRNTVGVGHIINNATNELRVTEASYAHNQFAWNAGLGVDYKLNKNMAIGTSYQYHNLGKVKSFGTMQNVQTNLSTNEPKESNLSLHTVNLGITYFFN